MGSSAAASPEQRPALTFSAALRARDDGELVTLLRSRPDLASPSPSTLRSLAARATGRASTDRALASLTTLELQVLESVAALGADPGDREPRRLGPDDVTTALEPAADVEPEELAAAAVRALVRLLGLALVWDAYADADADEPDGRPDLRVAPGVDEVLGPYPAGLGPRAGATPDLTALDDAPPGARAVLAALTWGPPVGLAPRGDVRAVVAADWLAAHGLVELADDRVVLPAEVALALRGGRTHRDVRPSAPLPTPEPGAVLARNASVAAATVDAESARAAVEAVRLVADLVRAWEGDPPAVLRTGGLAQRDLRRAAVRLDVDDQAAARVAEHALAAGLVADDNELPPAFAPTTDVDTWLAADVAEQWARLAGAWSRSPRTAWLAATRDEHGALRSALDPTLTAPWAPRLRRTVLGVLADHPGLSFTPDDVHRFLAWASPRSVPSLDAVTGVLADAERLGVVALGTLGAPGRELTGGLRAPAVSAEDLDARTARALAPVLPAEVDELLLQGDLTGIVPGRPTRELARLVEQVAVAESRGSALSVRFTPDSITRALAAGRSADELLAALARHARGGVPQPLEYLVHDAARRFGRVRVGAALSYVRVDDPALARLLLEALRPLGALQLAPTVLAAQVPASQLHAALAAAGHTAALEGPDGRTVTTEHTRARVAPAGRRGRGGYRSPNDTAVRGRPAPRVEEADRLLRLVAELRARDDLSSTLDRGPGARGAATSQAYGLGGPADATSPPEARSRAGTTAPADLLALLHEAITERTLVDLQTVDARGVPVTRTVRPLRLDGGRLRALDPVRDAELTVAVHRIAGVRPVPA
jgi:hypothetical protein